MDQSLIPMQSLCSIIVSSFYNKADLEQWLKPGVLRTDYSDILNVSSNGQFPGFHIIK